MSHPPTLDLLTCAALLKLPAQRWLIDTHIPQGAMTLLYGPSGEGKSFVALDWALSIAAGVAWLGQFTTRPGVVVYVACEGAMGLPRRVAAWLQQHPEIYPENMLFLLTTLDIYDDEALAEFFDTLDERFPPEHATHPDTNELIELYHPKDRLALLVIDTLARAFQGDDENSAREMGLFIERCQIFKETRQTAVLLVHHSSRAGGNERGSTALRGAMDAVFSCKGTKAEIATPEGPKTMLSRIDLLNDKQKDDIEGGLTLAATRVELTDLPRDEQGRVVTSLVLSLVPPEEDEPASTPKPPRPMTTAAMLDMLGAADDGWTDKEWQLACRITRETYYRRRRQLLAKGLIRYDEVTRRWSLVPRKADDARTKSWKSRQPSN